MYRKLLKRQLVAPIEGLFIPSPPEFDWPYDGI